MDFYLSHNNPCFQRNVAISNFLVSHTIEIRFHDVISQSAINVYVFLRKKIEYMADLRGQMSMFWDLIFFKFNSWIQLCD